MRRVLTLLTLAAPILHAQDDAIFKAQSTLATLRFHVLRQNHYVTGLKPEDVILLEDGVPRKFTVFENAMSSVASTPVELTLLFDTSGSVMDHGLLDPLVFRESLLDSLPNVRLAVYGFGQSVTRYSLPTRDYEQLQSAFRSLGVRGEGQQFELQLPPKRNAEQGVTWLYEAILAVSKEAASTPGQVTRMVMVFSDGLKTTTSKPEDAADLDRELGIPVYPVILGHLDLIKRLEEARMHEKPAKSSKRSGQSPNTPSQKELNLEVQEHDVEDFVRMGELTGGRAVDPPGIDLDVMKQVLAGMVTDVRTSYTIGFPVDASPNPKKHKLEVRLADKDAGKVKGGYSDSSALNCPLLK